MQPMIAARQHLGRLSFLDETGVTTNMVRRWGRARKGQRVKGFAPGGHWRIANFRKRGLTPSVLEAIASDAR